MRRCRVHQADCNTPRKRVGTMQSGDVGNECFAQALIKELFINPRRDPLADDRFRTLTSIAGPQTIADGSLRNYGWSKCVADRGDTCSECNMPIFARHGMKHITRRDSQRVDHFSLFAILSRRTTNFPEIEPTLRELSCDERLCQCGVGFYVFTRDDQSPVLLWGWAADLDVMLVLANRRIYPPLG
jgi:hypothetical protein